jgi:nucleoid-associated protein YejK
MSVIEVLGGTSVPYIQDNETKKWIGTIGHSWEVDNSYVKAFAIEADKKVKNKTKNHGSVKYPPKPYSLASSLQKHLELGGKASFLDFVTNVQKSNNISLETSRAQSKLVLIFLKYKKKITNNINEDIVYVESLLVMLLKDKSALRFEDNGSPKGTDVIDFDDVMQAAIININDFSNAIENKEDIDISFINGKGGTTDYFIDFFDAKNVIKNKDSVSNVLKALEDFSSKYKLTRSQRSLCDKTVKTFIEKNERNNLPTKLDELSSVIYSALKTDTKLKIKIDSFSVYVQEYDYKVNEEFNVGKNDRDSLEFISMETDVGSLKLKKSLFEKKEGYGNIQFNVNSNELSLKTKITDPSIIRDLKKLQEND